MVIVSYQVGDWRLDVNTQQSQSWSVFSDITICLHLHSSNSYRGLRATGVKVIKTQVKNESRRTMSYCLGKTLTREHGDKGNREDDNYVSDINISPHIKLEERDWGVLSYIF